MSWDVVLMNATVGFELGEENHAPGIPLGPKSEVLVQLSEACPLTDFSDPSWGVLEEEDFSIEFNMGGADPVDNIMLHVGGADGVIKVIRIICEHTGWRAFDTTTAEFLDFEAEPGKGLHQWRDFRDRVMVGVSAEGLPDRSEVDVQDNRNRKRWEFWK